MPRLLIMAGMWMMAMVNENDFNQMTQTGTSFGTLRFQPEWIRQGRLGLGAGSHHFNPQMQIAYYS